VIIRQPPLDPAGAVTDYEYDSLGQKTAEIGAPLPAEDVGLTGYAPNALVRLRTEYTYDGQGRLATERTNIVQPVGTGTTDYSSARTTSYNYDANGNLLQTTLPDPDGSGPLVSPTTSSTYDALGRKTSDTNQMGQTRTFAYNADGRLASVQLPPVANPQNGGAMTNPTYQYGYDVFGNQTSIQDPLGRVTQFTFDERGNELSRTLPLGVEHGGFTETFQYDDLGRQTLHVSFEGAVTQSIYDPQTGRLSEKRFFDNLTDYNGGAGTPNETWTYEYDAFDRVVSVTQSDGTTTSTTTTTYDENGNVASITSAQGVLHYEYDPATGLKTRTYTTDPANPSTVLNDTLYTYDVLGRLNSVELVEQNGVALATPQTTTDEYDLAGNLREQIDPNGSIVDYFFNDLNQLDEEIQYAPDGTTKIAEYDYTLEADGKRTAATETFWSLVNGVNTAHVNNLTWQYDADGRLTDEALASYDPTLSYANHYTLDLVGNQLSETKDWSSKPAETIANSFDDNDRLLSSTDTPAGGTATTTTYGYGPGNAWTVETGETAVAGTVTTRLVAYGYNLQGELSVATVKTYDPSTGALASDQQTTYGYDDNGIRVSALVQTDTQLNGTYDTSVLTEYLNDPANPTGYSQVLQETTTDPTTGQVQKVVVYTIGASLISQTTTPYTNGSPGTPETLVFGYDGHGSVRVLLDMASAIATVAGVQQLFHYDAYGNLLNLTAAQAATSILYSGQMLDGGSGLYYNRARWYDSQTGRFNSLDPFFGNLQDPQSLHKYLYTEADSINGVDPAGLLGVFTQEFGYAAEKAIEKIYDSNHPFNNIDQHGKWTRFGVLGVDKAYRLKPDILNRTTKKWAEIKPFSPSGIAKAIIQGEVYYNAFKPFKYFPDAAWVPSPRTAVVLGMPIVFFNDNGIIFYTDYPDIAEDLAAMAAYSAFQSTISWAASQQMALAMLKTFGVRIPALVGVRVSGDQGRLAGAVSIAGLVSVVGGFAI